jgi:predicted dehydrogenase
VRLLLAGGGAFGEEHLRALEAIGGLDLALAEPNTGTRARLKQRYGLADTGADAIPMMDRFRPQGVIVATPAATHAPIALAALSRDIPVLIEKPVAPDSATVRHLRDAAAASRAFAQPGHILRFSEAHRQLAALVKSGEIGEPVMIASRRYRDAAHAVRYTDVDPVLMTLVHDIDLALWLDGSAAVSATARRQPAATARSLTTATLRSARGTIWQLSTAWVHPGPDVPPDRVEVVGTRGGAELTVGAHIDVYGETARRRPADLPDDPLGAELDGFLKGIVAGRNLSPVSLDDALDGILAAEMILDALRTG